MPGRIVDARLALDYGLSEDEVGRIRRESPSQTRFVEAFFAAVLERSGKRRWAEKTPLNVMHLDWILEHFPEARFVHVIRDGRDAAVSIRTHSLRRLVDGAWVQVPQERTMEDAIGSWRKMVERGLTYRADPRYLEIRYEDLVASPEPTIRGVIEFLDEPYDPAILEGRPDSDSAAAGAEGRSGELDARGSISAASVGRWRRDLSDDDRAVIKRHANDLLVSLGYATDDRW